MEKKLRGCMRKWTFAGFLCLFLAAGSQAWSAPPRHTVREGDTLKSICEQYYGDPALWPKLWKKNPSVTNPENLSRGMVIVLFEEIPFKKTVPVSEKKQKTPMAFDGTAIQTTGVDVSDYCNLETLGFLASDPVSPWGHVAADETQRVFLSKYDKVYVAFEKERRVKPGDLFTLYRESENLDHPLSGSDVGHEIIFLGKIVLLKQVRETIFKAEIVDSYRVMRAGDPVLPYKMVSPCVQPTSPDWKKCEDSKDCGAAIVNARDQAELMGQYSVVYINHGYKNGIRRGNLFAIVDRMDVSTGDKEDFPNLVLGYLLVLESRMETATAVVLKAKKDFPNGTAIKAVNLEKELKKTMTAQGLSPQNLNTDHKLVPVLLKLGEQIDLKAALPESLRVLFAMVKCSPN